MITASTLNKPPRRFSFLFDLPALTSGLVAVLVGFTSSVALLFQAGQGVGATPDQTSSIIAALCFGAGITSIAFALYYKKPILTAFSTPASALLAANTAPVSFQELIGAFLVCGLLITLAGATGWFEKILNRIPTTITSAMLAGVLLKFGLEVFTSLQTQGLVIVAMLVSYFALKRLAPRYSVIGVLVVGLFACASRGLLHLEHLSVHVSTPVFTKPEFSLSTILGFGLPIFAVTMASQNLTGIAVLRSAGYQPPISSVITGTGIATALLAPFGCYGINFAAITAAIVTGPEAHEDSHRRFIGAVTAGVLYILIAIFAATVSLFFRALPSEFVVSLAGIALFSTIGNSLAAAVRDETQREPALLTFLVTASGVTLFGIGSAFWGLTIGALSLAAFTWKKVRTP